MVPIHSRYHLRMQNLGKNKAPSWLNAKSMLKEPEQISQVLAPFYHLNLCSNPKLPLVTLESYNSAEPSDESRWKIGTFL